MAVETAKFSQIIEQFTQLRLVVGYLGGRKQSGWWNCDFLDATGLRFLETVFPRTARAAALRSTTEAACLVHDKALGRVGNYHLFRLPPSLEDLDKVIGTLVNGVLAASPDLVQLQPIVV